MKQLRLFIFTLLALLLAGAHQLFACDEVFPGLLLCRSRPDFYRAALAAGVTDLGVETFEDSARTPVGQYNNAIVEPTAFFGTQGPGGLVFVRNVVGGHAWASQPRNTFDMGLQVRAVGFDFVKEHPEIVRVNSLGWVLSSGFVGFVQKSGPVPVLQSVRIDNFTCIAPNPQSQCVGEVILVDNIEYPGGPHSSPVNPQPPVTCPDSVLSGLCFVAGLQPAWYDPPTTIGYRLTALDGKFTAIDDFPPGFSAPFNVSGDGVQFGQFGPGQPVAFPGGVTELTVTGITPAVDGSSPLAFPIKLSLNTVGATFVMRPLTESDIDNTPPTMICAGPDGFWHSDDVSLVCTSSDAGSGLSNAADASFALSTAVAPGTEAGDAQTGSRNVCDAAGNCIAAGPIGGNRIDKILPVIAVASPVSGAYALGQVVTAAYTCTDTGSGIGACGGTVGNGAPVDTSSPGSRTFSVVARDVAGNISDAAVTYTVSAAPRLTGSGYNSPETAAYRATFSMNAGGPLPTAGSVQYSYSRTRMNFVSTGIGSVAVNGSTVTVQGAGTVNGASGYSFTATGTDGSPDAFGIVIRRPDGSVYYSAPNLALAGGAFTLVP
jgi:hypothetical protein